MRLRPDKHTSSLDTSVCALSQSVPIVQNCGIGLPSLYLSLVICICPLEIPHAAENREKACVPFPLQETMTSLAAVYFALESSPSSVWGAGSLYTYFQGFLFTFEVCLHASVLLGGSLTLQVITSGELKPSWRWSMPTRWAGWLAPLDIDPHCPCMVLKPQAPSGGSSTVVRGLM